MIFSIDRGDIDSEKERNLYAKFFAGYYLNELTNGYEERVNKLSGYLSKKMNTLIQLESPAVSFDAHAYLLTDKSDRGEFADILLHDKVSKTLIAIEAKYLTNWSEAKDISSNMKRVNLIKKEYPCYKVYFALLISIRKWEAAKKMANHPNSNYSRYMEKYQNTIGILFWEDLLDLCDEVLVRSYMSYRLSLIGKAKELRYPEI